MEKSPVSAAEQKDADDKPRGAKKKSAKKLGVLLVEPDKRSQPGPSGPKKPDGLWRQLTGRDKAEKPSKTGAAEQKNTLPDIPKAAETAGLENQARRRAALEAYQLHSSKPMPERIGHILVVAGARPETIVKTEVLIDNLKRPVSADHIDTMERSKLLELSDRIVIEGSSLRQIYETHLIGERGLRRLAQEYVRGADIHQALRQEILEHEIDFERDPALRDRGRWQPAPAKRTKAASTTANAVAGALGALLAQAGAVTFDETAEQAAVLESRAAHQAREQARQIKHQRLVDISMISTIALLIAIIILLILGR